MNTIIKFFLENRLITAILLIVVITWGIITAPFQWQGNPLPTDPVAVDAIPDIGENQQIVFSSWPGRSPQDIEDQVSYPLTSYLLGIPGVKSIRSTSILGFSSIYIIFSEEVEFYWSRTRILEKLNALPSGLLPEGVDPTLGPDATALGQVFWYTIEGRTPEGEPTGGWDLHEIRSVQDFYVKYALNAVEGVSEVASIGGFIQEYQVDVDPEAMRAYGVGLNQVMKAVSESNQDVGAKTLEINQAEYLVRGLGLIENIEDIEQAVVGVRDNTPIRIEDIARVSIGPAVRRGILDKEGAEVVGGVVVARYGSNPKEVIEEIKDKIEEISSGLPSKELRDGTRSQLTIVPFYDRSTLIEQTLGTLEEALSLEILISLLVVLIMIYNIPSSVMISSILPIGVLMVFIAMRYVGIDANIVSLSGIAIAIGTMVDLGIILTENVVKHLDDAPRTKKLSETIYEATSEVSGAILTAVSTTIISFIPVFTLQAAEGKLFTPLAFTKSFALLAALIITLIFLPAISYWFFGFSLRDKKGKTLAQIIILLGGITVLFYGHILIGTIALLIGLVGLVKMHIPLNSSAWNRILKVIWNYLEIILLVFGVILLLSEYWLPLGPSSSYFMNTLFVVLLVGTILGVFYLIVRYYTGMLKWCLENHKKFLSIPIIILLLGSMAWLGFGSTFRWISWPFEKIGIELSQTNWWQSAESAFPGLGEEFMPALDEGSFLLMPTSMPHSGIEYNRKVLGQLDMLVAAIPEVDGVVGKLGRVDSPLDPAPISMYENIINYKAEYATSKQGERLRFKTDSKSRYITKSGDSLSSEEIINRGLGSENLIQDPDGEYFRNWRPHIQSTDDIWHEISQVTKIPGVTSAPKLQPIETRLVMLQTGMRAPMGIKIYGPDLKTIEEVGREMESILKESEGINPATVFADRIVGKPYLQLEILRKEASRFGLSVAAIQQSIQTAVGGMNVTSTIEGRERYNVRVRYPRELRQNPEDLSNILIPTPTGISIPLGQVVKFKYEKGPQAIKSENTFLVGYVLFDKLDDYSEVAVVEMAQQKLKEEIQNGSLVIPSGVNYIFSGTYENQVRAEKRLSIILPIVLIIIFLILYLQFRSVATSFMIFSGIALAFAGGFVIIWLYGQSWFMNFDIAGQSVRNLFQMGTVNLSVAVWVGFIALFGIATDNGVLIATYLDQQFKRNPSTNIQSIRESVVIAGEKRIRPAMMTAATTIIALLPVLTSTGRGADVMVPMAIPSFGGMIFSLVTVFLVPVLYSARQERALKR